MIEVKEYYEGIPLEGFIAGMPDHVYHSTDAISKSGLDRIEKSPAHYNFPMKSTPAMQMGTLLHCMVLEPDKFRDYEIVAGDRRGKEYKQAAADIGAEFVILTQDYLRLLAMAEAVRSSHPSADLIQVDGYRELSGFATDPETGLTVRCRYDILGNSIAIDLKKTRDATARGFEKSILGFRYHVQAALYSDVFSWITGRPLQEFWFVAVEESEPYTCAAYYLDDFALEAGRYAYRRNLNTYAECKKSGEWPKYEPESNILSLPAWVTDELEIT